MLGMTYVYVVYVSSLHDSENTHYSLCVYVSPETRHSLRSGLGSLGWADLAGQIHPAPSYRWSVQGVLSDLHQACSILNSFSHVI